MGWVRWVHMNSAEAFGTSPAFWGTNSLEIVNDKLRTGSM